MKSGRIATFVRFGALILPKILKLLTVVLVDVLIARHLGVERFGFYSVVLAAIATLSVLSKFGLDNVLVRDAVDGQLTGERVAMAWIVRVLAALIAQIVLVAVALSLPSLGGHFVPLLIASCGLAALGAAIFEPVMQADERFFLLGASQSLVIIVGAVAKIYFLMERAPFSYFWLVFLVEAATSLFITAIYLQWTGRFPHIAGLAAIMGGAISDLGKEGLPFLLAGLSVIAFMRTDQFMLAAMSGAESVGVYSAALRISESFFALATLIGVISFPRLIRLKNESKRRFEDNFVVTLRVSLLISLFITAVLILLSNSIIEKLYGSKFSDSARILALHSLVMLPAFWGVITHRWLVVERLGRYDLYRNLLGLCTNVVGNVILIPRYGAEGACIATVAAQYVAYIVSHYLLRRLHPLLRLQARVFRFWR